MVAWRVGCADFQSTFCKPTSLHTLPPLQLTPSVILVWMHGRTKGTTAGGGTYLHVVAGHWSSPLRDVYQQHWPAERLVMQPQKKKKEIQKRKMKGRPERSVWRCYLGIRDSIWAADRFALWTPGGLTWNDFDASLAAEKTSRRR